MAKAIDNDNMHLAHIAGAQFNDTHEDMAAEISRLSGENEILRKALKLLIDCKWSITTQTERAKI